MGRSVLPVLAALLLAAPAAAGISGSPHDVKAGETQTIDIDFSSGQDLPVSALLTQVPAGVVLVDAAASDPAWIPRRAGRDVEWQGGQLPRGAHVHLRLGLRFREAGPASVLARITYVGGAYDQASILLNVRGSASQGDLAVVLLAGAAIFVGAVAVFVFGRRALRA